MADEEVFHQASAMEDQRDRNLNAASSQTGGTSPTRIKQQQDFDAFRALVGTSITDPASSSHCIRCPAPTATSLIKDFFHTQPSQGVYGRAQKDFLKQRLAHSLWSTLINFLFVFQILFAATFTGLSAYGDQQTVLTILGAMNTVCAGLLALLKGQGLPNRLMKARSSYENIVGSIEDAENVFAARVQSGSSGSGDTTSTVANDDTQSPQAMANKFKDMYNTAKQTQQDNHPDVYVSGTPNNTTNAELLDHLKASFEGMNDHIMKQTPQTFSNTPGIPQGGASSRLNLCQTINSALRTALSESNEVLCFGEDVAFGGVFRCTLSLQSRFGDARVFNTPITEQGIVGAAIGMAAEGAKPVAEIQFADYVFPAFDQIVNESCKFRYREGHTGANL
ncbi:hypothetical protein LTS10_013157 [Elasticomyces elasticus]|nr:hypothetical protein LTS10_013157 [Elasticomyces elasticus]